MGGEGGAWGSMYRINLSEKSLKNSGKFPSPVQSVDARDYSYNEVQKIRKQKQCERHNVRGRFGHLVRVLAVAPKPDVVPIPDLHWIPEEQKQEAGGRVQ